MTSFVVVFGLAFFLVGRVNVVAFTTILSPDTDCTGPNAIPRFFRRFAFGR